jgi:methyl-accepting chemotaxis protein
MQNGEFALAKIKHQTWRLRLRSYLLGSSGVREAELTSPHECALGKWIYQKGVPKHGDDPEMQQLEREHASLHEFAEKLVRLKKEGHTDEITRSIPAVQALSDRIVLLLNKLGEKFEPNPL